MVFQNDILAGASGVASTYQLDQSIRFNDNDSAYLYRTFGTDGGDTWSWSFWVKRGVLGTDATLFYATGGSHLRFLAGTDVFRLNDDGATSYDSTQVFRDPSAWYHVLTTGNGTENKVYVNNAEVTLSGTPNISQVNSAVLHSIGRISGGSPSSYFDGYMSEIIFVDGQALDPTDFGEYNDDGVWIPKAYAGSYGTNGFYITGADSADLGADYSGNSNDFTSSGLTSADQVTDTPTDNHCVLSVLDTQSAQTFSDGNLAVSYAGGAYTAGGRATFALPSSGNWYWEAKCTAINQNYVGILGLDVPIVGTATNVIYNSADFYAYVHSGQKWNAGSGSAYGASFTTNDIIGVALSESGELTFYKNGTTQGTAFTGLTPENFSPSYIAYSGGAWLFNFGQSGFTYTPPTGFVALSTANLPTPTIADGSANFQTTLYTGDGNQTQTLTQGGNSTFNPDFIWIKNRSNAYSHNLNDAVRGYTGASPSTAADVKVLASNNTDQEGLDSVTTAIQRGFVQESTSDGFIVNKGTTGSQDGFYTNASGHTYAAWQWLAANGTATNEVGTITSTVSANTTAGFSIVSYTGNATGGATIGHGLSQAPEMVITKSRDNSTGRNWAVYHVVPGPTKYGELDNTNIFNTGSTRWNDTAPSSTVVTLGSQQTTNDSGSAMIAYCWHSVEGFSKFGSYTGNGSTDGPFIFTGFKPAFVLFKKTSGTDSWELFDNTRPGYNATDLGLFPNTTASESTGRNIDILSNGIKQRNANGTTNESGQTYIFMAFAEHPFGGDGVAPVPAR